MLLQGIRVNSKDDDDVNYGLYRQDPVGFGENVLKEKYTDQVKDLLRSVRDNQITVAKSANATGKTHAAARVAIWFYKCYRLPKVFTAAAPPLKNLEDLLWGEIGNIIRKNKRLFRGDYIKSLRIATAPPLREIDLADDSDQDEAEISLITGLTIPSSGSASDREATFSGKHAPNLLFILDEGDAIPDEVYRGIESCMSGGHVRLLIMFNPRAEQGEPYRMERDKRANVVHLGAFQHPNVVKGEDIIPGAVTRGVTIRRINEWCRPTVADEKIDSECFELPAFLAGQTTRSPAGIEYPDLRPGHYKILNPAFSYMVLGQYPAHGSTQLINAEWINRARTRWDSYVVEHGQQPPTGSSAIMGVDIGEYGTDSSAACFRYGGYIEPIITWGGVDTFESANRASIEFKSRRTLSANVDATGIGSGVAPVMVDRGCRALPVKVAESPTQVSDLGRFNKLRDQLWWSAREFLRTDPGAMLPPDEELVEELLAPTYEIVNGKVRIMAKKDMREILKRSPDRADALCLTFYQPGLLFPDAEKMNRPLVDKRV